MCQQALCYVLRVTLSNPDMFEVGVTFFPIFPIRKSGLKITQLVLLGGRCKARAESLSPALNHCGVSATLGWPAVAKPSDVWTRGSAGLGTQQA